MIGRRAEINNNTFIVTKILKEERRMKKFLEERVDYTIPAWQELGAQMFIAMLAGALISIAVNTWVVGL